MTSSARPEPNPVHEAEREESRYARQTLSEMERAYFDDDIRY
jgi:hypothetical protein